MTIGTALVILALLYLIDKYGLWKRAAAICGVALFISLAASRSITATKNGRRGTLKQRWSLNGALCASPAMTYQNR